MAAGMAMASGTVAFGLRSQIVALYLAINEFSDTILIAVGA
jgi:hypothetical protein